MRKKNGFTLIEILAVIIIVGIIMIIAVPAVTKYIFKTNKAVYASDVSAFVESVRAEYEMKEYGSLLKDDEIMVVPIKHIVFEKGNSESSPYGEYDFDKSYVLIVPERSGYSYYATVIDSQNVGIIKVKDNEIGEDAVKEDITTSLPSINVYNNPGSVFDYNGRAYKRVDVRIFDNENVSEETKIYVFKDTGVIEQVKIIQLFSHLGPAGMLEYFYEGWRFNGEVVDSVAVPLKTGYTFEGYYTGLNGNGKKVINGNGSIVTDIEEEIGSYTTVYADYSANPLVFNGKSYTLVFSDTNNQTINITAAANGTGHYVYTEVSELNSTGSSTNYITISGTTITVAKNTPVDSYTYVVHAQDEVSGSAKDATFTITIGRSNGGFVCSNKTFDGTNQTACTCNGGTLSGEFKAINYRSTAYTAYCTPDGNHTIDGSTEKQTRTWSMNKKELTITAKNQTINYGGTIATGVNQVTAVGLVNGDSLTAVTLTPSTSNATTNGTITPSAATASKGISNYDVTYKTGVLKINRVAGTFSCSNKTYDGTNQTACTCSGGTISGTISATNYSSTPYTAYCTPDGNHTINGSTEKQTKTWAMAQKALTITAKAQTIDYGGSIATGVGQVTTSGLVSGDSLTGITLTASTTNATTNGTITPKSATTTKGIANYAVTYNTGKLVINRVAGSFSCSNKTFDGTNQTACTCSGGTLSGTTAATNYSATAYTAYCTPDGNHTINGSTEKQTKTWTMSQKALTITAKDQSITYGNSIATGVGQVTASGLVSGDSLTGITLTASTANVTTNGTITPKSATSSKGIGNYSVTYKTGKLTIGRAAGSFSCSNKTFDGTNQTACTCSGGTLSGTTAATNYSATAYTAYCTPDGNHTINGSTEKQTKTWTMSQKALTITAKDQSITYGNSIATGVGQVTASGLVSGDSLTGITLTASTANVTTNGTITPKSATASKGINNYAVTYKTGKLVINKKALTITAKAQTINYGNSIATGVGQVTTSGLVSGDSLTGISLTASTANVTTNGTITPSGGSTSKGMGNYTVTYKTGKLVINKVNGYIELSASSGSASCGGTNTFTVTRHHGGTISCTSSNPSAITCSVSGTTITVRGVAAGSSTITVTSGATQNYNAASKTYSASASDCYEWLNSCTNYNWDCTHDCGQGPCEWRCEYRFGVAPLEVKCGNPSGGTSNWPWNGYCWCKYRTGVVTKNRTCDTSHDTVQC